METLTRPKALDRGYWIARALLDPAALGELRNQVEAICRRHGWLESRRGFRYDSQEFFDLQLEVQSHASFSEIRAHPGLQRALATLLGGPVASRQGDVCRILFPDAPEFTTPAHQDQLFLKRQDEVWSAWIPLADCPRGQGSLAVIPRSNTRGLLPHDERGRTILPPRTRWRYFDFSAGDVLFVHALTVHRALENRSRDLRISVDYRFSRISGQGHRKAIELSPGFAPASELLARLRQPAPR